MNALALFLFFACPAGAVEFMSAESPAIDQNFKRVDEELIEQDLTDGGTVQGNIHITGDQTNDGDVTIAGDLSVVGGLTLSNVVNISSVSMNSTSESTVNTCNVCVSGSTITITGRYFMACYAGDYRPNAGTGSGLAMMGHLINGACPTGMTCHPTLSSANLASAHEWTTNGQTMNLSYCRVADAGSTGTHNFCLLACNNQDGGTVGFQGSGEFSVRSIP